MCGINGFTWEDKNLIQQMNRTISYRGPDDSGILVDKVSLGHNRLSVVDLSKNGHQPMADADEKARIVYNGEIYNHAEIRQKLEKKGYRFNSNSDTEVIINAYLEYGEKCLSMFNGMFAFAIWDGRKFFLARDRLGIKPLYYFLDKDRFIFSSEMKAILCHSLERKLDRDAMNTYLSYRFIPDERTILKGIRKLQPGHSLLFEDGKVAKKRFWKLSWSMKKVSENAAADKIDSLLMSSIKYRLMSDVPLGAFLSGGLDSSLVVAMNSKIRQDPVKTFSVGFDDETDEFSHAKKVSEKFSTEHKEVHLDYSMLTKNLPKIVWHMDEPNSDPSMFPLYFLSKETKKKVTVVNTGEGADELFSGYYHYRVGAQKYRFVPRAIRSSIYSWYYSPFKQGERRSLIGGADSHELKEHLSKGNLLNGILSFDLHNEIPNWQLPRVDRMTMAHAIEARVPFLDHRMVEYAASLPPGLKQKGNTGKYILRKVGRRYLPRDIVERKKQGFTTPLHAWAKHELEELAGSMLSDVRRKGINHEAVNRIIQKHKKSKKPRMFDRSSYQLLILLNLEVWMRMYLDGEKPSGVLR